MKQEQLLGRPMPQSRAVSILFCLFIHFCRAAKENLVGVTGRLSHRVRISCDGTESTSLAQFLLLALSEVRGPEEEPQKALTYHLPGSLDQPRRSLHQFVGSPLAPSSSLHYDLEDMPHLFPVLEGEC